MIILPRGVIFLFSGKMTEEFDILATGRLAVTTQQASLSK